ncbi:hypothetical protein ACKWTF_015764 [Chironomus riparius]
MPNSGKYKRTNEDNSPEPESQVPFEAFIRPPLRAIDKYAEPKISWLSHRYTVAVMAFLGFAVIYGTRFNLMMARMYFDNIKPENETRLHWSTANNLDSFSLLSNLVAQLPGGLLAYKFPSNKVFGLGVVCSAVLNILIPLVTEHQKILVTFYFLQGFAQGLTIPALFGIWRFWSPTFERSKLTTIALSGMYAGMMLGTIVCEHLSTSIHPTIMFIFFGLLGILWYGFWYWLVLEKPRNHPTITEQELMYIEKSLGESAKHQAPCIPWIKIMTSLPVFAIVIATFCQKWSYYTLGYYQSRFLRHTFSFKINEDGLIAILPYIMMLIILLLGGFLSDFLRQKRILSTTNVRKFFLCVSFIVQGVCLLYLPNVHTAPKALLLILGCKAMSGFAVSGFIVNHLDIAPRYASIIMGISNTVGFVAGIACPILTDLMTFDQTDKGVWSTVFSSAGGLLIAGAVLYVILSSGQLQSWAEPKREEQKDLSEIPAENSLRNDTKEV